MKLMAGAIDPSYDEQGGYFLCFSCSIWVFLLPEQSVFGRCRCTVFRTSECRGEHVCMCIWQAVQVPADAAAKVHLQPVTAA